MLFIIITVVALVMTLYLIGVMTKIALEDNTAKKHREDFDRIVHEVEKYRQLHRTAQGNAFGYDGLLYRVNRS